MFVLLSSFHEDLGMNAAGSGTAGMQSFCLSTALCSSSMSRMALPFF